MHEFLDQIYFDNTLREYTIALDIILLGFLFKRFIARYIALFISYLIIKRYKDINKTAFRDQVARPLGFFIIVFIIVVALDKLNFPHKLDITIYHLNLKELFRMVSSAILIISFFRFLIKCIDFATLLIKERYLNDEEHGKHQLVYFFKDVIKVLIGLVGLLLILKYTFNYDIKGLVTGLSIVGAAVALALKESLENFIASFVIFFDKPFGTGDSVKINGVSGTIENIGLRSTRIRTEAKTYVTVPNKQMVDSIVDNLSNRTQYRGDFRLEIVPDTAPPKIEALISGIKKLMTVPDIQNFHVYLNNLAPNAIIITSDFYTAPQSADFFNATKQKLSLDILSLMNDLGIAMAGTSTTISIAGHAKPETA